MNFLFDSCYLVCVLGDFCCLLAVFCYIRSFATKKKNIRSFAAWVALGLLSSGVHVRAGTTKLSFVFKKKA